MVMMVMVVVVVVVLVVVRVTMRVAAAARTWSWQHLWSMVSGVGVGVGAGGATWAGSNVTPHGAGGVGGQLKHLGLQPQVLQVQLPVLPHPRLLHPEHLLRQARPTHATQVVLRGRGSRRGGVVVNQRNTTTTTTSGW